ncbi:DNA-binding protein [Salmonella enterica subsp. enterica]|nr:DNA-binding protein [Salmonella enterica subsp. enterica serovar Newport]EBU6996462.1 DNA-binding protein [Salmonella enterica subsp. enterica serovar Newport]
MSEKQVRDYDKFMVRFPDGMRDAIAERAKANGRSMNSEIVQILGEAVYGLNSDNDEFEKMFEYVITETPSDEDDWIIRDRMLTQLIFEITSRLEKETSRLKTLFNVRAPDGFYTQPTHNEKKPT